MLRLAALVGPSFCECGSAVKASPWLAQRNVFLASAAVAPAARASASAVVRIQRFIAVLRKIGGGAPVPPLRNWPATPAFRTLSTSPHAWLSVACSECRDYSRRKQLPRRSPACPTLPPRARHAATLPSPTPWRR